MGEIAGARWKQLGYRSASAYIKGLVRYDAMVMGDHSVTLPLSNLPEGEQEGIDEQLLVLVRRGVGERGQLLQRLIELTKAAGAEPTGQAVAETIKKRAKM